jgi:hypothetical protein
MDIGKANRRANHDNHASHASRLHLTAVGRILGSVPPMKLEGGCYRSSRANHLAGNYTDKEAGSVKGKSLAGAVSAPY